MSRFVILRHDGPRGLHFDFLLEVGQTLKTWALPQPPTSGVEMTCQALPDHRLAYLDYEGPVSGDRGSVTRWDRGTYQMDHRSDSELAFELSGEKLTGRATLSQLPEQSGHWRFSFAARPSHA